MAVTVSARMGLGGVQSVSVSSHGGIGQVPDKMRGSRKLLLPGAVMKFRVPDRHMDAAGIQPLPPQPCGHGIRQKGNARPDLVPAW